MTQDQFNELCRWYLTHVEAIHEWQGDDDAVKMQRERLFRGYKSGGKTTSEEVLCCDAAADLGFPVEWMWLQRAAEKVIHGGADRS